MSFTTGNNTQRNNAQRNEARYEHGETWSLFGDDGNVTRGISANPGSEYFQSFVESAKKRFSTANEELELKLVSLDREIYTNLHYGAVVVVAGFKKRPELGLAYHTLLLEATGDELTPIRETFGNPGSGRGKEVEVLLTASAAMDDTLNSIAQQAIKQSLGVSDLKLSYVEGTVVPRHFDVESVAAMQRLLWNAVTACTTELDMARDDRIDTDMSKMERDSVLSAEVSFGRQQLPDAAQNPMRSDVSVGLTARRRGTEENRRNRSVNSAGDEKKLTSLSGFVEIVPVLPLGGSRSLIRRRDERDERPFGAMFVITDILSNRAPTPENILLALSPVRALNLNSAWSNVFRPRQLPAGEKIDTTDIGALNIQGNLQNETPCGSMVNTRDSNGPDEVGRFIGALVEPDMMVAIDIPEFGPQSWYLSFLSAAANGNQQAIRAVIGAAHVLTGGRFSNYFRDGDRIFAGAPIRVHAGTFENAAGNIRDIRYVDYLYAANTYGERDHAYIADWTDTFLRTDYPEDMRLDGRLRMMQALTGETVKVTGYYQRLVFTKVFLDALNNALEDCGVNPRVSSNEEMAGLNTTRGYASFAQDAMLSGGGRYGSTGRGYSDRGSRGYTGRW